MGHHVVKLDQYQYLLYLYFYWYVFVVLDLCSPQTRPNTAHHHQQNVLAEFPKMAMRAADDERFWSFWPTLQLKTFNIMIPSSPELNSEQFPFFRNLERPSGSRDII